MLRFLSTAKNNKKIIYSGSIIAAAILISLILRSVNLSDRPLHNDEAVNSIKFKHLLENFDYKYDPIEYHGPTLYYFTLISTAVSGESEFSNLSEFHLRSVNVFSSLLLLIGLLLIRKYLSVLVPCILLNSGLIKL